MSVINFNSALNAPLAWDNTSPSAPGSSGFADTLAGLGDVFPSDEATAALADLLGGTPIYQSGLQSGTGPFAIPNYNQIRLSDGTLVAAGAARYNIDLVGLDRYKEQLAAVQAFNASMGYTDPAFNVPVSQRYSAVQQALGPVLVGSEPRASASATMPLESPSPVPQSDPDEPRASASGTMPPSQTILQAFAEFLQRFGIEK